MIVAMIIVHCSSPIILLHPHHFREIWYIQDNRLLQVQPSLGVQDIHARVCVSDCGPIIESSSFVEEIHGKVRACVWPYGSKVEQCQVAEYREEVDVCFTCNFNRCLKKNNDDNTHVHS